MSDVSIDKLVPGATTARPVSTPSGLTLVGAGTVLTASLIARLRSLGVAAVAIVGAPGSTPVLSLADQLAALDARFARHAGDPIMVEMRDMLARQLSETPHAAKPR
ncbi:MAG: hypothetical protein ACHQO8_11640 [Vicinamibacterales bacterium]